MSSCLCYVKTGGCRIWNHITLSHFKVVKQYLAPVCRYKQGIQYISKFHQKVLSGCLKICKMRQGITYLPYLVRRTSRLHLQTSCIQNRTSEIQITSFGKRLSILSSFFVWNLWKKYRLIVYLTRTTHGIMYRYCSQYRSIPDSCALKMWNFKSYTVNCLVM